MINFPLRRAVSGLAMMLALTATGAASVSATAATTDTLPPTRAQNAVQTADLRNNGEMPPPGAGPQFGGPGPHGPMGAFGPGGPRGPGFAAVRTIEEIAHLYRVGGHPDNVLPFYRETLAQTRDPMLRHHLRDAIAREELKPADTTAAIATLRAQLNEDLAALPPPDAKRR